MDINNLCPHCLNEIKNKSAITECPFCHKNPNLMLQVNHQLKAETILAGKYLVGDVLGEGGFGITYVGFDLNLEMKVAIKEFYPNGYATRESNSTSTLTLYTGKDENTVKKWRNSFIKEARSLAKCSQLAGVVGVKDFFQENNTAYIIMEYLEGETLKSYIRRNGGKVDAAAFMKAIEPVMLALDSVHKEGIIHRDISPDNIMLLPGGEMKLLDFGAARSFDSGEKSLSVMLKPGFAPEEQYRSHGNQGPWSDVYAFAGTIYKAITGTTPPESMERLRKDEIKSPKECGINLSDNADRVLMKALAVLAENRYQSMREFHDELYAEEIVIKEPEAEVNKSPVTKGSDTVANENTNAKFNGLNKHLLIGLAAVFVIAIVVLVVLLANNATNSGIKKEAAAVSENNAAAEADKMETETSEQASEEDNQDKKNKKTKKDKEDEEEKEEHKDDEGIHRYEYVVADITWKEAFEQSLLRGGYLAHLNTDEETAYVLDEINKKGLKNKCFFIGAARKDGTEEYYWLDEDGEPFGECLNTSSEYKSYWLEGEPSFSGDNGPENYLEMIYRKSEDKWYFNDIPNDIVAVNSKVWAGKVAYIIEYDDYVADSSEYILPESDSRYYTRDELSSLGYSDLKLARNEIFAKHGRKFRDSELNAYFSSKSWYVPAIEPEEFDATYETRLNDYEKENINLIKTLEEEWDE
ncbi:protein kinase domain-containing protein [Lachnospiraceae bacterium C1.1]|nr:YARHG domain-containing protein [Lachnospiraceae bacterium C1.1]